MEDFREFNEITEFDIDPITRMLALGLIEETAEAGYYRKVFNVALTKEQIKLVIMPYVLDNVRVSNVKLEEATGINRKTIAKVRNSQEFLQDLLAESNKQMINVRSQALTELSRMIADPKVSDSVKQKLISSALQHSSDVMTLYAEANKNLPKNIDVDRMMEEMDRLMLNMD